MQFTRHHSSKNCPLILLHSERPKLYGVLAVLSAIRVNTLRPDFTSKLVYVLAFRTPKFYVRPNDPLTAYPFTVAPTSFTVWIIQSKPYGIWNIC